MLMACPKLLELNFTITEEYELTNGIRMLVKGLEKGNLRYFQMIEEMVPHLFLKIKEIVSGLIE